MRFLNTQGVCHIVNFKNNSFICPFHPGSWDHLGMGIYTEECKELPEVAWVTNWSKPMYFDSSEGLTYTFCEDEYLDW